MSRKIRSSNPLRLVAGILGLALLLFAGAAEAKPLDAPRAAGTIGERYDGYVVLRDSSAPQSVKTLVSETNAQREALYQRRAKEDNVPIAAIQQIYAEQIRKSAPKGTYFLDQSGKWTRK